MAQVLIIGGGLAGLSCALRLLQQGQEVTVVEKQRGSIDRVCGEGVLPFGVVLLEELGLAEQVAQKGYLFDGVDWVHGEQRIEGRFSDGRHGMGIERAQLDAMLKETCNQFAGFTLKQGHNQKPGSTAGFDYVLAADGIRSSWGKAAGKRVIFGKRIGLRFRLQAARPQRVTVHFFHNLEIYLTPVGHQALSVAVLIDAHKLNLRGGQLKNYCRDFFRTNFPQYSTLPIDDMATRAPISSRIKGTEPKLHLLGDALCAFDPISGAGMSFALLCGKYAAENLEDVGAYYRSLRPARAAVAGFTRAQLLFRGGGIKTRLMFRQLALADCFNRILALHNGRNRITDLNSRTLLSLLRPF